MGGKACFNDILSIVFMFYMCLEFISIRKLFTRQHKLDIEFPLMFLTHNNKNNGDFGYMFLFLKLRCWCKFYDLWAFQVFTYGICLGWLQFTILHVPNQYSGYPFWIYIGWILKEKHIADYKWQYVMGHILTNKW